MGDSPDKQGVTSTIGVSMTIPAQAVTTPSEAAAPAVAPDVATLLSMSPEESAELIRQAESGSFKPMPITPAEPAPAPAQQPEAVTPPATVQAPAQSTMPAPVNAPAPAEQTPEQLLEAEIMKIMHPNDQPPAAPQTQEGQQQPEVQEQMIQDPESGQMVPLSALLALRKENKELKESNSRLEGYREAASQFAPANVNAPPAKTPEKEIEELQDYNRRVSENFNVQRKKLAAMVDSGDLSMVDFLDREELLRQQTQSLQTKLSTRMNSIQEEANRPTPEQVRQMVENDPYLVSNTEALVQRNPWINNLPDATFEALRQAALASMKELKLPVNETSQSVWNMRQAMVNIGQQYGYDRAFLQPMTAPAPAPQPAPQHPQMPNMTLPTGNQAAVTAQQRAEKLQLSNSHPPSPAMTGLSNLNGSSQPFQSAAPNVEGMTALEIANSLPKETLDRILYGQYA
jgi:hypothetical protein